MLFDMYVGEMSFDEMSVDEMLYRHQLNTNFCTGLFELGCEKYQYQDFLNFTVKVLDNKTCYDCNEYCCIVS